MIWFKLSKCIFILNELIITYSKVIFYKILYLGNLRIKNITRIRFPKGCSINLDDYKSLILIGENFCSRKNVKLRVTGGILNVGNNVFMNNDTSITCRKKIIIDDNCLLGENVKIYDHDHIFSKEDIISNQGFINEDVIIGKNVWIGSNSIILKGSKIGDNVVIGAGSIIKGDIPSNTVVFNKREILMTNIKYKK